MEQAQLFEVELSDVMHTLENISDQPYWSLNLMGENTDFGLEHLAQWTREKGYRYIIEINKHRSIDRIYCVCVKDFEFKWFVIHGGGWNGIRFKDGAWDGDGHYRGYSWPTDATIMMYGSWTPTRYFNIHEAIGYEPEAFAEEMGADLAALQRIMLGYGDHYLRGADIPVLPQEEV